MHFACSEAYLVIKGQGFVQTLSSAGFREIPLRAGSLVWFTPGLIHRLINLDAQLEIFAVMENAGLPEHGDSVLTFPPQISPRRRLLFASRVSGEGTAWRLLTSQEAARNAEI